MIKFVSYFTSYLLYVFLFLFNEGNYFGMTGAMAATLTVKWPRDVDQQFSELQKLNTRFHSFNTFINGK